MSQQHTTCGECLHTYEFYGRFVPPCPRCGWPEVKKSGEEWARSLGVYPAGEKDERKDQGAGAQAIHQGQDSAGGQAA